MADSGMVEHRVADTEGIKPADGDAFGDVGAKPTGLRDVVKGTDGQGAYDDFWTHRGSPIVGIAAPLQRGKHLGEIELMVDSDQEVFRLGDKPAIREW